MVEDTERRPAAGVGTCRRVQLRLNHKQKEMPFTASYRTHRKATVQKKMLWAPALGSPTKQVKCQSLSIYKYTRAQSERILGQTLRRITTTVTSQTCEA